MENENRVIKFYLGEETKPVIEGIDRLDDSIFRYQIQQALTVMASRIDKRNQQKQIVEDENNNIVAFVGERGAGKTSCMYSVIKILEDIEQKGVHSGGRDFLISNETDEILLRKRFSFIQTIDPSFFDIKHNILELIIGKMYAQIEELKRTTDQEERESPFLHALLKEFSTTKTHLRYLASSNLYEDREENNENDAIEELAYLASGIQLKESIRKLIFTYLEYQQKDILVISLDDIDLNTSQAYRMVEQIRKYLILPNVVIFMAIKLDQLSEVIQLELCKQFQNMLGTTNMSFSEIVEMSERYLMKLIPLQSRVYLPMPETFFQSPLEIYINKQSQPQKFESIKRAIPEMIFKKCRYLFYNTRGTTSLIVPRNLRELRLLISMLYMMPPYEKNTNRTLGNKQLFKRYFFGSWLDTLSKESRDIAHAILAENEPTLFNKTVIRQLVGLYFKDESQIPDKYKDIIDIRNLAFNVSLADCFCFMEYIGNTNLNTETQKLLFFIKSIYSIRLYEYYDELTDNLRKHTISHKETLESTDSYIKQPYRTEILENISSYEKLIGGSFYLLEGDTLISPQRISGGFAGRELRLINGKRLIQLIKEVSKNPISKPKQGEDNKAYVSYVRKLKLAEFFMLTISRYVWTTDTTLNESGIHKYRLISPAYYDRRIYESVSSLCFDALAPLFTLLNIHHAYERFDDKIYDIAFHCKDSLVYKLLNKYGKEEKEKEKEKEIHQERFLSKIGLRNAEIIEDIFTDLKLKRRAWGQTSDNTIILKNFYKSLGNYNIASYDYEDDSTDQKLYYIGLEPFQEFEALLDEVDSKIFDTIFVVEKEDQNLFIDIIGKTFKKFLSEHKRRKQSTIITDLQKYNPDFLEFIGEEKIKIKFSENQTFNISRIKEKLEELCKENNYILSEKENDDEEIQTPKKFKNIEETGTTISKTQKSNTHAIQDAVSNKKHSPASHQKNNSSTSSQTSSGNKQSSKTIEDFSQTNPRPRKKKKQ